MQNIAKEIFETQTLVNVEDRIVPVNEAGKSRKVSKLRATIIRTFDNAYSRGQNGAAGQIFDQARRLTDKAAASKPVGILSDQETVDQWLRDRAASRTPAARGTRAAPCGRLTGIRSSISAGACPRAGQLRRPGMVWVL